MKPKPLFTSNSLRQKTEEFLRHNAPNQPESEALKLIQELLANQLVLEKQNSDLTHYGASLKQEQEIYQDIINHQPAGIYRIRVFPRNQWQDEAWSSSENPPYVMELASDRFCGILGISRQDFENDPATIVNIIHAEDKITFVQANVEANENLTPFSWEGRLLIGDKITWVRLESVPRPLENGDIIWSGIVVDITERKTTEAALIETRLRLENVVDGVGVGIMEWNLQTGALKFNHVWPTFIGYEFDELTETLNKLDQNGWLNFIHPDDIEIYRDSHMRHMRGETPFFEVEARVKHKDGHWVWLQQLGRIVSRTPDGLPLMASGIHTDISKRKLAEEKLSHLNEVLEIRVHERTAALSRLNTSLHRTEQKFRTVADFTYNWEYWVSPNGDIAYMSPSVERITGYTVAEFVENPSLVNKIIHPKDHDSWNAHRHERCIDSPSEISTELTFRIVTRAGDVRWIAHVCRCINIEGKHQGIRVSNRDVTEKIEAQNELLRVTVAVEERERNRFSRELHDGIGPLLFTIQLYFQWLSECTDDETKKVIIEKGNKNIDSAMQTTRELSRGLSSDYLNKWGYIDALQDFVSRINDTHKLPINFNYNQKVRFNNFLEATLYRISTELLKNTLTYAQATAVEISFVYNKTKNNITFAYSDNGIGFDLEQNKHGLGIINIQQRVQIMKGNLNIDTAIGQGIKVEICFPVEE